jgi:hypothetical protein
MAVNHFFARTLISLLSIPAGFLSIQLIMYAHETDIDIKREMGLLVAYYFLPFLIITGISIRILWTNLHTIRLFLGSKKGILLVSLTTCIFLWVPTKFLTVNDLGFALLIVNAYLLAIVIQINMSFLFGTKD